MNSNQMGLSFLGAVVLGLWLWLMLFGGGDEQPWGWSLLGLAMAGAVYGIRATAGPVRTGLWIGLGLAVGALLGAFFTTQAHGLVATLFTFVGGGLVASTLPAPGATSTPRVTTDAPRA